MAKSGRYWYKAPSKPIKLDKKDRKELLNIVKEEIAKTTKLKKDIVRINIRGGRIYLFSEWELKREGPFIGDIKKGDMIEEKYARISIFDKEYTNCTLDWLRHNDKWVVKKTASLVDCIKEAEDDSWFCSIADI